MISATATVTINLKRQQLEEEHFKSPDATATIKLQVQENKQPAKFEWKIKKEIN
jgi:hypothetical protein